MIVRKRGTAPCTRRNAQTNRGNTDCTVATTPREAFCSLYRLPIIDALPKRCPLAQACPTATLQAIRDTAFGEIASGTNADLEGAMLELERAEKCLQCLTGNARHPRIKRLRKRGRVS